MTDTSPSSALQDYLAGALAGSRADVHVLGAPPRDVDPTIDPDVDTDLDPGMAPEIKDDGVSRLLLLLRHLAASGSAGMPRAELVTLANYGAANPHSEEARMQQDLKRLRDAGWGITNVSAAGEQGRYVLQRRDLAGLTAGERSVLQAVLDLHAENGLPNPADRDVPECIWQVAKAVDHHSIVSMTYRGQLREVHPVRLHTTPAGWWLRARDEDGMVKWFRLDRMTSVQLAEPRSAEADIEDPGDSLNPHTWAEDPPQSVQLSVAVEHLHSVLLTFPDAEVDRVGGDDARVQIKITNRAAFFGWLVEMGTRVQLTGPAEVLDDVRSRLEAVARRGEGPRG
ncbi:MAG: WYL domain-containing protein [Humibacillus sp.]